MNQLFDGNIEKSIKTTLADLGYVLSGITTAEPIETFSHYQAWIEAGYHGDMHYLARPDSLAKRANPAAMLHGVKSIIVVGIPYIPYRPVNASVDTKTIASYAQGPDYHRLIPDQLEPLVSWLQEFIQQDIHTTIFTDSAPILEQELAIRAGLGWRGKNDLVINPTFGSFFLLAEIFLDIALKPDEPISNDLCGNCRRCVEACPTQCILANRTIDARRCLSYLTIEKRGGFSTEESQLIGDSVFGCDICQMVCPWNDKAAKSVFQPLFMPQPSLQSVKHGDLLTLNQQSFKHRFGDTPIARAKRTGMLRNLLSAMGNQGTREDITLVSQFVEQETDPALITLAEAIYEQLNQRLI